MITLIIVSLYKQNIQLEWALEQLHQLGIAPQDVMVTPLSGTEKQQFKRTLVCTRSMMDIPFVIGTISMLLGCIYGFLLYLGPIIWGLIGLICGIAAGLGVEWLIRLGSLKQQMKLGQTYVLVWFQCVDTLYEAVVPLLESSQGFSVLQSPAEWVAAQ